MRFCGIDEAALGSILGPFCACLVEIVSDDPLLSTTDFYEVLKNSISRNIDDIARPSIADSKALYNPTCGIHRLEHNVRVFFEVSGMRAPHHLHEFVHTFCPAEDARHLATNPWFCNTKKNSLPLSKIDIEKIRRDAETVRRDLRKRNMKLNPPRLRFITAATFNGQLKAGMNKAETVRTYLLPLIAHALRNSATDGGRISIDRQGGRRYYSSWLNHLIPESNAIVLQESQKKSVYALDGILVEFMVSADRIRLETALASMFAKYLREVAMHSFNNWWRQNHSSLRGTAGYPLDGRRFVNDLEEAKLLPKNRDILIRRA